jgi:hypothetical protein
MKAMKSESLFVLESLLILFILRSTSFASILGDEWEKILRERVSFGGFIENTTGLSVGRGDRHFNTSNRFDMNRLTLQPELNVRFRDDLKFFIAWRFVKEPRYNSEARNRRKNSPPLAPLPNTFYDEDSFKPWELVVDLLPSDRLSLRLGRQFVSWGETDGFRLLDLINPQDARFSPPAAPNLFSLEETRIPVWGVRALYTVPPGSNTVLELLAMPGFDETKKRVDEGPPTAGRWASHPETRIPFGRLFADPIGLVPVVIPSVIRDLPDAGDNWRFGGRIIQTIGKLNFGLGYLYTYNPQSSDLTFKLLEVIPGPSGTTVARLKLANDRTSIYAAHFNYSLDALKTGLRGELAFYPSKPYNISKYPGPSGLGAGPHPKHPNGRVGKNTIRYALGADWTSFVPFLHPDDPFRDFRFSLQLFQSIILDHENGIRFFSTREKIKQVSSIITFRASTGYLGDTWLPDVFISYDPEGYGAFNPALSYAPPWNERIRFTVTSVHYWGRNKFKSLGLFDEKDSIFLKMRYQF